MLCSIKKSFNWEQKFMVGPRLRAEEQENNEQIEAKVLVNGSQV